MLIDPLFLIDGPDTLGLITIRHWQAPQLRRSMGGNSTSRDFIDSFSTLTLTLRIHLPCTAKRHCLIVSWTAPQCLSVETAFACVVATHGASRGLSRRALVIDGEVVTHARAPFLPIVMKNVMVSGAPSDQEFQNLSSVRTLGSHFIGAWSRSKQKINHGKAVSNIVKMSVTGTSLNAG